jgi:hypothetical protein
MWTCDLLLAVLLTESAALQALCTEAWARSPSTPRNPWSLLVAFDEFVPGNKLSTDHSRKIMVESFTFLEPSRPCLREGLVHPGGRPLKRNRRRAACNSSVPSVSGPCFGTHVLVHRSATSSLFQRITLCSDLVSYLGDRIASRVCRAYCRDTWIACTRLMVVGPAC